MGYIDDQQNRRNTLSIKEYSDFDILIPKLLEMKTANINAIVYKHIDESEVNRLRGAITAIDTAVDLCKKILSEKERFAAQFPSTHNFTHKDFYWDDNGKK